MKRLMVGVLAIALSGACGGRDGGVPASSSSASGMGAEASSENVGRDGSSAEVTSASSDGAETDGAGCDRAPSEDVGSQGSDAEGSDSGAAEPAPVAGAEELTDDELVAQSLGWTLEEVRRQRAKNEAMDVVTSRLAEERADVFIGGALGEPNDAASIYIKGPADAFILELVAGAPIEIRVIDEQPYSRQELDERTDLFSDALIDMGYVEFAVGADIQRGGLLEATVRRAPGAPDSLDELIARLPASLRGGVEIELVDEPVVTLD